MQTGINTCSQDYGLALILMWAGSLQSNYAEAVKESTKALELDPNYMKALMRRAQAQEKLENFQDAITGIV